MIEPSSLHPAEARILASIPSSITRRTSVLQLMAFDIDGVLTNGTLWYSEHGETLKSFHVLDGHGLRLLKESGIRVALVTGRQSSMVARRGAELGIETVAQGIRDKASYLSELAQNFGLEMEQIGFMGDDLIDLHAMQKAGFAASVPNAPSYVMQAAHWVANAPGGSGAVRECCDLILASQGKLAAFFTTPPLLGPGAWQ